MTKPPKLSIALLSCNRAHYAKVALEALLNQSWGDFELLFMDNHSADETTDLILSYKDPRLIYVRQPPGRNPSENEAAAIWMSRGQYILITHDDDVSSPFLVERYMQFLQCHPDALVVSSNVSLIDEVGVLLQPKLYDIREDLVFEKGDYIYAFFEEKLWLPTPTLMYSREHYMKVRYNNPRSKNESYYPSHDILAMIMLNAHGRIALLADPLLSYRQHAMQESRNVDQSAPLYQMIHDLSELQNDYPQLSHCAPLIEGARARFQAQHVLFNTQLTFTGATKSSELAAIRTRWKEAVPHAARCCDMVLPFDILMYELGMGGAIDCDSLKRYEREKIPNSVTSLAYRKWAQMLQQGRNLFASMKGCRIAVFGSMMNAYLLVADAYQCGVEVICCLDSSPARIGKSVFGVEVYPHSELENIGRDVDAVVISSEREHDDAPIKIIRSWLRKNEKVRIFSWRELVSVHFGAESYV
ncbi:glycosyltransferase [Chromobacterium vaccinii]|uniref:Glycosyltransferase n=1 Tax=Chromobacterium vaccinii TaxID=1108595 RepID=A0ABV0FF75_9NEIS